MAGRLCTCQALVSVALPPEISKMLSYEMETAAKEIKIRPRL